MELKGVQRKWWENGLLLVIFVGMLGFIVNSYVIEQRTYKQRSLYYQLALMRQGINLFAMMEKRYPENLIELGTATYTMPGDQVKHRYVDRIPVSNDGTILDPFSNPYKYDRKQGWVQSTTPGYEFW